MRIRGLGFAVGGGVPPTQGGEGGGVAPDRMVAGNGVGGLGGHSRLRLTD